MSDEESELVLELELELELDEESELESEEESLCLRLDLLLFFLFFFVDLLAVPLATADEAGMTGAGIDVASDGSDGFMLSCELLSK